MEQIVLTAKIQLKPTQTDVEMFSATASAYRDACNFVSNYIFETCDLSQASLNKTLYSQLRSKFGLKAQMAQSVLKTVISKYKGLNSSRNRRSKPIFKVLQYDLVWNRDYSLVKSVFSINTIQQRIKVGYVSQGVEKYFDKSKYKFGTAKLFSIKGKWFLYIPVIYTVRDSKLFDICNVVGIDLGINFLTVTYNSFGKTNFISGRYVKQKRRHYSRLRKQLQSKNTKSARRKLKAIGRREHRWMRDVNHCVSKSIVQNNPEHSLFVLENLTGIRKTTEKVQKRNRYVMASWAFYDLAEKISYKAKRHQSSAIKVDRSYTSQTCPKCGSTDKSNRNKRKHIYRCKNCGYTSNDDRIAAMNLYRIGINYLEDTVATKHDFAAEGLVDTPMMR